MLASASEHYARQQSLARRTLLRARQLRFGPLDSLTALVVGAQILASRDASDSVPKMMAEQGIESDPLAAVIPTAFAGAANDGRDLRTLMDYTRSEMVTAKAFDMIVLGQVRDSARQASSVAMFVQPKVTGYVRMLTAPSCSRCAVLAGKHYRKNEGFQRHPLCDCRHIPASEDTADDLTTDPKAYFDSLDEAAQDRTFTKAGAQAIRDGADMGRVVNARRGMSTSQSGRLTRRRVLGQDVYTTTEATTKRGINRKVRLMPESIYEIADDQADALRLLKVHGYIR
jgi:hypothetical protein